jgi:hypothetical protein
MADIFDTDYETYIGELNISNPENAPLKRSQGLMARSRTMAGPRKDFSLPEIGGKLLEAGKVIPGAAVAGAAEGFVGLPGDIESLVKGLISMYNRPKGNPATSTAWSYGDDTAEDKEYPNYDVPQKKIEAFLEGMEKQTVLPTMEDVQKFVNDNIVNFGGSPFETVGQFLAPASYIKPIKSGVQKVKNVMSKPNVDVGTAQVKKKITDRHSRENLEYTVKTKNHIVSDEDGVAKTFYHGTKKKFDQFNLDQSAGSIIDHTAKTAYFASDKNVAKQYGKVKEFNIKMKKPFILDDFYFTGGVSKDIKMAYESVKRKILSVINKKNYFPGLYKSNAWNINADDVALLKKKGYDGIIVPKEVNPRREEYFIVFDSDNIINAPKGKVK